MNDNDSNPIIKKLNHPNGGFTHAQLISIYQTGDIRFEYVNVDDEMNVVRRDENCVANYGNYPFRITDDEYFILKSRSNLL